MACVVAIPGFAVACAACEIRVVTPHSLYAACGRFAIDDRVAGRSRWTPCPCPRGERSAGASRLNGGATARFAALTEVRRSEARRNSQWEKHGRVCRNVRYNRGLRGAGPTTKAKVA